MINKIEKILSKKEMELLFSYTPTISKDLINIPGKDYIDRTFINSDRNASVLKSLGTLFNSGRLAGSGYLSILPLDHGIEHTSKAFSSNPLLFDPENILKLALETGASGVVSSLGTLGSICRKYAHKIPLILKVNHNDPMSNAENRQSFYSDVDQAFNLGASGVAATLYFGAEDTKEQITKVSQLFKYAHNRGMFTILWAYLRNEKFESDKDYHLAADMTSQANYLGSNIEADIVKQKMPLFSNGFKKIDKQFENRTLTDHPIDMVRFQVLNSLAGRAGLLNSGGSVSEDDLKDLVFSSIVNKIAGGMGVMAGRKIFTKSLSESVEMMNFIHDIYLSKEIEVI